MVDNAAWVNVKKMTGKSWWQITIRLGDRKYEGDFYMLGARFRIASLQEQIKRYKSEIRRLQKDLDEYRDRYGWDIYDQQEEKRNRYEELREEADDE